jgi:Tfp pilus assembly protein PilF
MMEDDPTNIFPVFRLAIIHSETELEKAKEYLIKTVEMDPNFEVEKVNWALATIYVSEKDWKSALNHFRIGY